MFKIVKAQENDIFPIAQLLVNTWQQCYDSFLPKSFLNHLSVDHQFQRHLNKFKKGTPYFIAINREAKVLGFTSYGLARSNEISSTHELYTLYVEKSHHKKGIGKTLLEIVFKNLSSSTRAIEVIVMSENPFLSFYLKQGFEKVANYHLDLGLEHKIPSEILRKEL